MGWPRSGRGLFTWPAYKACEAHVILIGLTVLATLALTAPGFWLASWRLGVLSMAVIAPLFASARVARAVTQGLAEEEFSLRGGGGGGGGGWLQTPLEVESKGFRILPKGGGGDCFAKSGYSDKFTSVPLLGGVGEDSAIYTYQ